MQSTSAVFAQKTLRQVVHTSIGGSSARIRLSNKLGSTPVTISDVHIARSTGDGSTVDTTSDEPITFGGSTSVMIPVGGEGVSDSVAFSVPADSDVAVSFYVPTSLGYTQHDSAQRTNYYADGDQSVDPSLSGALSYSSYSFLENLDVQDAGAGGSVVAFGASITDAFNSNFGTNTRWTNDLAKRLIGSGRNIGVLNEGISGNNLLFDGGGQAALTRFQHDALEQPHVKWVIFSDDPINDLLRSAPPSTQQLINGLTQLINETHAAGVKFLCSTLTPFKGTTTGAGWNTTAERSREAVNTFLRSSASGCDGIVDQATATGNPQDPAAFLPAYDSGDHLHPNDAGHQAIANAVPLSVFDQPGTPVTAPSLESTFDNVGVTQDTSTDAGNFDGGHATLSAQALSAAGLTAGRPVSHGGVALTWPAQAGSGAPDNTVTNGQVIKLAGTGSSLDFLATSTYGPVSGTGTITYTDGSVQSYTLGTSDWFSSNGDVVAQAAYQNRPGNTRITSPADIFFVGVPLQAGKTVSTVRLPKISIQAAPDVAALHVFAMGVAATSAGGGTAAGDVEESTWTELVNRNSGKCVDDANNGLADGNSVQQWACSGATSEQWRFLPAGNGYDQLQNRHAASGNESFDVKGGTSATQPGALLQTWAYGGSSNQKFKAVSTGDGYYELMAQHSGLCLGLPGNSVANGVQLAQNTCSGATSQQFRQVIPS